MSAAVISEGVPPTSSMRHSGVKRRCWCEQYRNCVSVLPCHPFGSFQGTVALTCPEMPGEAPLGNGAGPTDFGLKLLPYMKAMAPWSYASQPLVLLFQAASSHPCEYSMTLEEYLAYWVLPSAA